MVKPFGLHAALDASLVGPSIASSAFFESAQPQLDAIGLSHRFRFGLVERTADALEPAGSAQEACAVADMFAVAGEAPSSRISLATATVEASPFVASPLALRSIGASAWGMRGPGAEAIETAVRRQKPGQQERRRCRNAGGFLPILCSTDLAFPAAFGKAP